MAMHLAIHLTESLQADRHVAVINQMLTHRELHVHVENQYSEAVQRDAVKGLLVRLRVQIHRRQVTRRLHKEQVRRQAHRHLEMMAANRAAVVQVDHDVKIKKDKWSNVVL